MRVAARLCLPDDYLELRKVPGPSVEARLFGLLLIGAFWFAAGCDTLMLSREATRGAVGWGATLREVYEIHSNSAEFVGLFARDETTTVAKTSAPSKFGESPRLLDQSNALSPKASLVLTMFAPQGGAGFAPSAAAARAGSGGIVEASRVATGQSIAFVTARARAL